MRQIYPAGHGEAGDVGLAAAYAYPPAGEDPDGGGTTRRSAWVRANMVASIDGAATLKGLSGGLSTDEDRKLFHVLRGLADVILVGAGTVRAEGYGPARPRAGWAALRAGRPPSPLIAVMTRALDLDVSAPIFTEAPRDARTIVLTTQAAPASRCEQAARYAEVVIAGTNLVEPSLAIAALAARGLRKILVEGGPHLLGELAVAGLLDELCLTVSPILAGGDACRIMADAPLPSPSRFRLAHVLEAGGSLFCRYVRELDP